MRQTGGNKISATDVRGVTLMELLVVVATVAILSSLAYPSYISYVQRSNRTDAYNALLRCAAEQERWFTANNTYLTPTAATNNGRCNAPSGGLYTIAITNPGCPNGGLPTCFLATATAVSSQANDADCTTLTIDDTGLKGSAPKPSAICWRQ